MVGGIKAAVNIGVLVALKELHLDISAISGSSIGALVAIMYAMECELQEMTEKIKQYAKLYAKLNPLDIILSPFNIFIYGGVKNPKVIEETIEDLSKEKKYNVMGDFKLPIFIPSLDITTKQTIYYSSKKIEGPFCLTDRKISEAIRSTTSLPLLFKPNCVNIYGKQYQMMDGGMECNTPTMYLEQFSDFVIGIATKYNKTINHNRKVNLITGIRNSFQAMRRSAVEYQRRNANLWIEVDLGNVNVVGTDDEIDYCIKRGYEETMKQLTPLKELLKELLI